MSINQSDDTRFAILIGINNYNNSPLSFCDNDVRQMRAALEGYCKFPADQIFPIISTKEEPLENVYKEYKAALENIKEKFKQNDTILFYFSGHGKFETRPYLLFQDQSIAIQEIYDGMNDLKPGSQFYIIDACYSGFGVETKGDDDALASYYNERFGQNSNGVYLLCSSRSTEKSIALPSIQQSIYTWNFLNGIKNDFLYDVDLGSISIVELHNYAVKRILLDYGYNQTPYVFLKAEGYFPFAYLTPKTELHEKEVVLVINNEDECLSALERSPVNFPKNFKRDFSQFSAELVLNLYRHNLSTKVEIKVYKNTIEIFDYSRRSFNPFTAEKTQDGNGLVVYELFLTKYNGKVKTSYAEGFPNIIRLDFDASIFQSIEDNPCLIDVKDDFMYRESAMNAYVLQEECKEIIIDMTRPAMALSFIVRYLFDYLIRHTSASQLIILKLEETDMQRDHLRNYINDTPKYSRILLV